MNPFKYLVYDIESVTNKPLLNKVLYAGEGLSDEAAYQKHLAELAEEKRDFVNPAFHQPVSIAALAVSDDLAIQKIGLLGAGQRTPGALVRDFWKVYNEKKPIFVDFNGRGYDLRLMEIWAFQLGLKIDPAFFAKYGTRHRFSDEHHLDLHEFLTNYGAIRYRGGLDYFAKLLGKPGKMDTKGHMVQTLWDQEKYFSIDDYCLGDAMDTYFVFLRTKVLMGHITLDKEADLVTRARAAIEKKQVEEGFFKLYLENFGVWEPTP